MMVDFYHNNRVPKKKPRKKKNINLEQVDLFQKTEKEKENGREDDNQRR